VKKNRETITKFKIIFFESSSFIGRDGKKRREKIAIRKKKFEGKAIIEKISKVR